MTNPSIISKNKTEKSVSANAGKGLFVKSIIQPKLSINQPNDSYEQEADAIVNHVMRMTDASINNNSFFKPSVTPVQRKCEHCEEEEEKKMQRKENDSAEAVAGASTENYIRSLNGKGRLLSNFSQKYKCACVYNRQ